jgi:hypothetical protein
MTRLSGPRDRLTKRDMPELPPAEIPVRRQMMAGALSFFLHLTILFTTAMFWISAPTGTGGAPDRPVGIAVVYDASGTEAFELMDANSESPQGESGAESVLDRLPSSEAAGSESASLLDGLMPKAEGAGSDVSAAAGDLGLGSGGGGSSGSGTAKKTKTSVFGVEGEGARFVYVFDISDSMNGYYGRPLFAAKRELVGSLSTLGKDHEFQVIFYNDEPRPFTGAYKLFRADDNLKKSAISFVKGKIAIGGTRHLPALKKALLLRPDVVFFLTDADDPPLKPSEIEELQYMASGNATTINAIQFGEGERSGSSNWIQTLARSTRGQYRYVDVSKFGE